MSLLELERYKEKIQIKHYACVQEMIDDKNNCIIGQICLAKSGYDTRCFILTNNGFEEFSNVD